MHPRGISENKDDGLQGIFPGAAGRPQTTTPVKSQGPVSASTGAEEKPGSER